MFRENKINPVRMAAIGYGKFRPIADNSTPGGRNQNRRVVVLLSGGDPKEFLEIINDAKTLLPRKVKKQVPSRLGFRTSSYLPHPCGRPPGRRPGRGNRIYLFQFQ